jgi:ribosomal protein L37E
MNRAFTLQNFFGSPFVNKARREEQTLPCCSRCGYTSERPHVLACSRCGTPFPGALGCSGCGRCGKK